MCTDCVITQIMDIVWMVFRMKIGTTSFHSADKTQFVFNKDLKNTWQLKTLKKNKKNYDEPNFVRLKQKLNKRHSELNCQAENTVHCYFRIFLFRQSDGGWIAYCTQKHHFSFRILCVNTYSQADDKKRSYKNELCQCAHLLLLLLLLFLTFFQWRKTMCVSMRCVHVYWNENKWMRFSKSDEKREKIDYDD